MTLQSFIDKLFESIFTADNSSLPAAVKYLFDLFDLAAHQHALTDPDVAHAWKSNRCALIRYLPSNIFFWGGEG